MLAASLLQVSTEKMYLANLRAVVDSYVKPLQNPVLQVDLALKPSHLKEIFSNLETLVGFHSIFYDELNHTVTTSPKQEAVAKTAGIFNKSVAEERGESTTILRRKHRRTKVMLMHACALRCISLHSLLICTLPFLRCLSPACLCPR